MRIAAPANHTDPATGCLHLTANGYQLDKSGDTDEDAELSPVCRSVVWSNAQTSLDAHGDRSLCVPTV